MTMRERHQQFVSELKSIYCEAEATNIAGWVFEHITGKRKAGRHTDKELLLSQTQEQQLEAIIQKLLTHQPVQYVLNEAWFAEMKFYVDENVLIPRPETEELVEWIVEEVRNKKSEVRVLDIGTGSGCIPITLKKKLPEIIVRAIDVSEGALNVAVKNAMQLAAQVYFFKLDFLEEENWSQLGKFDVIVSNPPYIKESEAEMMNKNVLEYEPHVALFVPDNDALLFYRKIDAFGKGHLAENGLIFLEINETLGKEVVELFHSQGYSVDVRKDMQGKERMVKAVRR
jgi:release factor glutamine methyltransferase